ncbi:MAG TPA: surface lipoprotein assembly modifier [Allosphingosinicella sp.]
MKRLFGLGCCWACLPAFAPAPEVRLAYDLTGLSEQPAAVELSQPAPEPPTRLPYDLDGLFDNGPPTAAPATTAARRGTARRPTVDARLTLDLAVAADSNINNATDLPVVLVDYGEGPVPVPLGAESRRRSGIGLSVGGSATADVRLSEQAVIAADAEAYLVDQRGEANDDASLLLAIGPEVGWDGGGLASIQMIAFQRWYGGTTASVGTGVRGALRLPAGTGRSLRLLAEARMFSSDYGRDFDGSLASVSVSYDAVLTPGMSGTAGFYLRRYWLGSDAFSNAELGFYGGVSRYFGEHLVGSLSAGVSRAVFDAPMAWMSADARRDWRVHGSLSARTRRPLLWSFHPSLAYSYGRTDSSVLFYDADRHVVRVGLGASF